jgi:hypothetical protein
MWRTEVLLSGIELVTPWARQARETRWAAMSARVVRRTEVLLSGIALDALGAASERDQLGCEERTGGAAKEVLLSGIALVKLWARQARETSWAVRSARVVRRTEVSLYGIALVTRGTASERACCAESDCVRACDRVILCRRGP